MGRGAVVLLAGPDGSGKSSLVALLKEHFRDRPTAHYWQRPGLLPRKTPEGKGDPSQPHAAREYGLVASYGKVLYVFTDIVLAWWLSVDRFRRAGGVMFVERGWWDMAVDPRRYRLRGVGWLVLLLGRRIVPAPDIVLVLVADAEEIAGRKQMELSIEETARQLVSWPTVLPKRVHRVYLDVADPLEDVARRAIFHVERSLTARR